MTWIVVGIFLVALASIVAIRARAFRRSVRQRVRDVIEHSERHGLDELAGAEVPEPIRRYLAAVCAHRARDTKAVEIEQRGTFWLTGRWQPFVATQVSTVREPGFVWDAKIRMGPLLHVRVADSYLAGEGGVDARLLGAIVVANDYGTRAMNCGSLSRYLAEAPFYPSALLPGRGVRWETSRPEEEGWARATLSHQNNTVSLRFHVGDDDLIDTVEGLRYRATDTGAEQTLWRGRFWDYGTSEDAEDGVWVPQQGEVAWVFAEGEQPYWRGRVERARDIR
ncbi:MAG: DUF6544 family protein [Trueperaceae bacterium]|nr:DUF6544 family protein [Trueperaceae bacterium]